MDTLSIILCSVLACSYIIVFALGAGLGYLFLPRGSQTDFAAPTSFLKSQGKPKPKNNSIEIDDTKVVLKVDTDGLEKQFDKLGREPTPPMAGTGFERRMPSMVGKYNTNAGFLSYVLPGGEVKNIKLSYEEMQGFKKALEQMGYTRNDSMPVANTHGFDLQRNR